MRRNRNSEIWKYLEETGVLEKGTDEEIKAAKRAYRKKYLLQYKQRQRICKPEYTLHFSTKNGEYENVLRAANAHKMSVTAFTHSCVFAYMNKTFIVPNREQVAKLEQLLSDCLNEVKIIVRSKEKYFWEREKQLDKIEKRIERLEMQVDEVFRRPPLVT
jgi:predicted nucleotide-binding protein